MVSKSDALAAEAARALDEWRRTAKPVRCVRCCHSWTPLFPGRPKRCARCKDPKWDVPLGVLKPGPRPKA